ncbi:MAG: hypothetical protein LBI27_07360, partial [Clostridiales bacterium]|nr:hypothetical protein [Clostridiales bacterium]
FISRAEDAPNEIKSMKKFMHEIICRAGEGSPDWNMTPNGDFTSAPTGDAAKALNKLVEIIKTNREN